MVSTDANRKGRCRKGRWCWRIDERTDREEHSPDGAKGEPSEGKETFVSKTTWKPTLDGTERVEGCLICDRFTSMRRTTVVVWTCALCTFCAYVERVGFPIAYSMLNQDESVGEGMEGAVMSSFFFGYAFTQVPSAWISTKIGLSNTLTMSFLGWSITSMFTPTFCRTSYRLILSRVLVGAAQGMFIPAIHSVLSLEVPPKQRSTSVSLATSGMYLGSALATATLPYIGKRYGPHAIFRTSGVAGLLWVMLWKRVYSDDKHFSQDKRLSKARLPLQGLPSADLSGSGVDIDKKHGHSSRESFSMGRLLGSTAFWSIVVNNFTFHYTFYTVLNWMPKYFGKGLGSELASLGMTKALPYIMMFVMANVGGHAGDVLIFRQQYTVASARKMINTIGFVGAAISVMMLSQVNSTAGGLLWISSLSGMLGLARGGFSVNHMDIAPSRAGILMGISNTGGTLSGLIGVAATGAMLEMAGGVQGTHSFFWPFFLCAQLCLIGSLFFEIACVGETIFV